MKWFMSTSLGQKSIDINNGFSATLWGHVQGPPTKREENIQECKFLCDL